MQVDQRVLPPQPHIIQSPHWPKIHSQSINQKLETN